MNPKIYYVGGHVRDNLLGMPSKDQDFVVVGANEQWMLDRGYARVGKDFPVFLHPITGHEYALARRERSTGNGYTDFEFDTVDVTLREDLARRDLTINAIAMDGDENVIDPFGGARDLETRTLRHVTDEGFIEDPVRVLRLARFCAKFPTFDVAPETTKLCKKMVMDGMLHHLTPERIAKELEKALDCEQPSRFFIYLQMVGALEVVFPELWKLVSAPAGSFTHHPEGTAFTHTMMVLDQATHHGVKLLPTSTHARRMLNWSALVHDLGKGVTNPDTWPKHHNHEMLGVDQVKAMCRRLKLGNDYLNFGTLISRYHTHVHNVNLLKATTIVGMAKDLKPASNPRIFEVLSYIGLCDATGRGSFYANIPYRNHGIMLRCLEATQIHARDVCTEEELTNVNVLKNKLLHAQTAAVNEVRKGGNGE